MEFVFEKNPEVEDITKVPEHFRSMYVEDGDKYVLNESLSTVANAIDGLNKANKRARQDADSFKRQVPDAGKLRELGTLLGLETEDMDLDVLREGIEATLAKVSKGEDTKVNLDKIRQDMKRENDKMLAQKDEELNAMKGTLRSHLIDNSAVTALAQEKGDAEILMPHIRSRCTVVEENGKHEVRVLDAEGDPRGDGKGGFMTVSDLVREMKESKTFSKCFESDGKSGLGAGQPGRTGGKVVDLSPTQKIARGLSKI